MVDDDSDRMMMMTMKNVFTSIFCEQDKENPRESGCGITLMTPPPFF
jgi:hypothetical protein